jgi:AcrR family transcriptional regulator
MANYKKGIDSRFTIINDACMLLNEKGLSLSMDVIAKELGLSRGRITHFFPTKDSLMLALMQRYEYRLNEILHDFAWASEPTFDQSFEVLELILDLQYDFRCAIAYLAVTGKSQPELHQHIESSFFNRIEGIRLRLQMMVASKMLTEQILEPDSFKVYSFQYTNLLTTWVLSQELYYSRHAYKLMKPVYIKAAMILFEPYLTTAGKSAYDKALLAFEKRSAISEKL